MKNDPKCCIFYNYWDNILTINQIEGFTSGDIGGSFGECYYGLGVGFGLSSDFYLYFGYILIIRSIPDLFSKVYSRTEGFRIK